MKIKKEPADSTVISKIWNLQKVALLPGLKIGDYSNSDWILAYLLTSLTSFDEQISSIRKDLGITEIYKYSSVENLQGLVKIFFSLGQENYLISIKAAQKIIRRYRLGENWLMSIQAAFFTDTLPVPDKIDSIKIETNDSLSDHDSSYCSIRVNHRITTNELKKWIKQHKLWIRHNLNNLPKINKPRIDSNTILWGHFAWILKKGGMNSWTEMTRFVQKHIDEFGSAYDLDLAPEPVEMERYYKRFVLSLKKIDN